MRTGLTLVEALVLIGIIALLIALAIPAIQIVRGIASHAQCMNKMRQLLIATQSYSGQHSGVLPSNRGADGSLYYSLLPYFEEGNRYMDLVRAGEAPGSAYAIDSLLCPADPTLKRGRMALSSYASNAQFFKRGVTVGQVCGDGTSNTIAFAEHFAFGGSLEKHLTQFCWYAQGTVESPALPPYRPVPLTLRNACFADGYLGDAVPVTDPLTRTTKSSKPGLTFQLRPSDAEFDPRIAQTGHLKSMTVGMGDGSVRKMARGISEEVYWSLVTPAGGETISQDWD
jgi:type II secretory pathway pseudopilin PulG